MAAWTPALSTRLRGQADGTAQSPGCLHTNPQERSEGRGPSASLTGVPLHSFCLWKESLLSSLVLPSPSFLLFTFALFHILRVVVEIAEIQGCSFLLDLLLAELWSTWASRSGPGLCGFQLSHPRV